MTSPRYGVVCLLLAAGLMGGAAWAAQKSTVHDTASGPGQVLCVTPNQTDPNPAEWMLSGDVIYSAANGGGGATDFTFSVDEDCYFATFTPAENYVDAMVAAEAVVYAYDPSTLVQTDLDNTPFANSEILWNPWPETRGSRGPANTNGHILVAAGKKARYKVRGGYYPANQPFTAVAGAWTDDL